MAFFIRKPIGLSGMFGGYPAGYDDDPAPLSYPFNKLIAVYLMSSHDCIVSFVHFYYNTWVLMHALVYRN